MKLRCSRCGRIIKDGFALSCSNCGAIACPECAQSGVCSTCYGNERYLH